MEFAQREDLVNHSLVSLLAGIVALLCLVFPFASASCGGEATKSQSGVAVLIHQEPDFVEVQSPDTADREFIRDRLDELGYGLLIVVVLLMVLLGFAGWAAKSPSQVHGYLATWAAVFAGSGGLMLLSAGNDRLFNEDPVIHHEAGFFLFELSLLVACVSAISWAILQRDTEVGCLRFGLGLVAGSIILAAGLLVFPFML